MNVFIYSKGKMWLRMSLSAMETWEKEYFRGKAGSFRYCQTEGTFTSGQSYLDIFKYLVI